MVMHALYEHIHAGTSGYTLKLQARVQGYVPSRNYLQLSLSPYKFAHPGCLIADIFLGSSPDPSKTVTSWKVNSSAAYTIELFCTPKILQANLACSTLYKGTLMRMPNWRRKQPAECRNCQCKIWRNRNLPQLHGRHVAMCAPPSIVPLLSALEEAFEAA